MKIQKTTDYKQFKFFKHNRDIQKGHIRELTKSIEERNLLEYFPIMVDNKKNVIDGQHRLFVAKELGVPIYFREIPDFVLKDMLIINSNLRQWRTYDYLKFYCEQKLPDYIVLRDFMKKFGFTANISLYLLSKGDGLSNFNLFKSGDFKVEDLAAGRRLARILTDYKQITIDDAWKRREFSAALKKLDKEYDIEAILKKAINHKLKITGALNVRGFLRQFEVIMNYKLKSDENYVRLF